MIFDYRREKVGSDRRHAWIPSICSLIKLTVTMQECTTYFRENIFEKIAKEVRKPERLPIDLKECSLSAACRCKGSIYSW